MKTWLHRKLLVLILLILSCLFGCGGDNVEDTAEDNKWIGTWIVESIDGENVNSLLEALDISMEWLWTFDDDGTWEWELLIEGRGESETDKATGTYSLDGANYTMSEPVNSVSLGSDETDSGEDIGTWVIKGDTLTLTNDDGRVVVLKRQ